MRGRIPKEPEKRRRPGSGPNLLALPASGRSGKPPRWPLSKATASESRLWRDLWASPQAVAWEEYGWTRVVARYARIAAAAEEPEAKVTLLNEARQLEDRLGLTPMSMLRLRWSIVDDEKPDLKLVTTPDADRWQKAGR